MEKLRPYQVEAARDIYDKKRVLIADDMGLGKTAEAIAARRIIDARDGYRGGSLVVCPASVKQHWLEEIQRWYNRDANISTINTTSFDSDVKSAQGSDFVILGYPTLSDIGKDSERLGALRKLGFYYGIIDEAHNAKNPESIRSSAVRELFHSMPYLSILSGTPIPNTVIDIYALLNLLKIEGKDKELLFPLHDENSKQILNNFCTLFRRDPELVSRVINEHRIRRTAEEYLKISFPGLNQRELEVILEGEHREVYLSVYENNSLAPNLKLSYLIGASIDPNLVPASLLPRGLANKRGKLESSVYNALDELVEQIIDSNGKVLIFSDRKRGVMRRLSERYSQYGALVIDGDVSADSVNGHLSYREEIRRMFQRNPENKVLITTTVMDEGVDLTAATDIIHLTLPYTPAAFNQRNRRSQRIGEVEKTSVNVHTVMPRLDCAIPVITEGIAKLLEDKKRIIDYIERDPLSLTKRDLEEIKNGKDHNSSHLAPIIKSPMQLILSHFGKLKGRGFRRIQEHYKKFPEEADYIARLYSSHWNGFYGGNTAEVYARIIKTIQETQDLERKLDIASGPFSLSRKIKEPVTNVDLNQRMLDAGKLLEEQGKIVQGNTAICSPFHSLPLDSNSFDLAVCSLALHYSKPLIGSKKNKINEREQVFREMNRVLKKDGYGIITLPHSFISESDFEQFYESLGYLGFRVLPFSGFYVGEDSKFRVYVAGLQKIQEPCKQLLEPEQMEWKMDKKYKLDEKGRRITSSSKERKQGAQKVKVIEPEFPSKFRHTKKAKSVEELVREGIR